METQKEETKETANEKATVKSSFNFNVWVISTIILAVIIISMIISPRFTGNAVSNQAVSFFKTVQGIDINVSSIKYVSGMYEMDVSANGQNAKVYMTRDGKYIGSMSSIQEIEAATTESANQASATEEIPQTDKPTVELYVMSFCPYGVNAENNILPVIKLLKDKIDFKIKFIVDVNGDKIEDVSSLHGLNEAKEDARQVVIMKYYPDKYYDYLQEFNANCYPLSRDDAGLDKCWKDTAKSLGMDVTKIETAAYGSEGINLLKQDAADDSKYSVTGSPTLMINGVKSSSIYQGTSAAQTAICSAFNTAPSDCSNSASTTTGSATANQPTGSCG